MKVICDRGALLDAVNLVAAVVPSRTPTPALSCVKLVATKAGGGAAAELTLAGTDAETSLQISLAHVDVQTAGQAAIPADKLRQIVSAEEGEPTLAIEVEGDTCHIRGANVHFKIICFPAQDFPPLPDFAATIAGTAKGGEAPKSVFSQPAGALLELVTRTMFATARETSRYAINGVLLKRDGKKLEMVATDGRRLALSKSTVTGAKGDGGGAVSCIVPTKALSLLTKLVRDPEETVRIAITDSRYFCAFDKAGDGKEKSRPHAVLTSTLVEGTFPPYEDVIPKDQDKKILANREELTSAVRKAKVLTNEESRGVRMAFGGKRLKLSSRAPEMGESEISIDLSSYEGTDIEISFNPDFITEGLKVLPDSDVIFELKAPNKPGLIRSAAGDFLYVVMPVNLPT